MFLLKYSDFGDGILLRGEITWLVSGGVNLARISSRWMSLLQSASTVAGNTLKVEIETAETVGNLISDTRDDRNDSSRSFQFNNLAPVFSEIDCKEACFFSMSRT